jgi:hypothetical protein
MKDIGAHYFGKSYNNSIGNNTREKNVYSFISNVTSIQLENRDYEYLPA